MGTKVLTRFRLVQTTKIFMPLWLTSIYI
jgi:hypothetical protein